MRLHARRSFPVLLVLAGPAVFAQDDPAPARPTRPLVLGPLPGSVEGRLEAAFAIALERLGSRPACRELYQGLERDGFESLAVTRYIRPNDRERQQVCGRRVSAFTIRGGAVTRLCSSFGRLPPEQAAGVLLHEGLHSAGLPEHPHEPGALRSAEINELVTTRCGL